MAKLSDVMVHITSILNRLDRIVVLLEKVIEDFDARQTRAAEQRDAPVHAAIELLVRIKDKVLTDENYDADEIVREVDAVLNMAAGG